MKPSVFAVLCALALVGCHRDETPTGWTLAFEPSADPVDFGLVTYEDSPPTVPLTLTNASGVPLVFGGVAIDGHGADLIVVSGAPADGAAIAEEEGITFDLALSAEQDWLTGWYQPRLVVTASGEPSGDEAPGAREWSLALLVKLLCDLDGDGYDTMESGGTDCDDQDPTVYPMATDGCDERDNDCDGETDEDPDRLWYTDVDGDGYGTPGETVSSCAPLAGYADNADDCDGADPEIHPGALEYCNRTDDDCDGETDEDPAVDAGTWYQDLDGDGWGTTEETVSTCLIPEGYVARSGDCNDGVFVIHPEHPEVCDGIDQDCDGETDEDPSDGRAFFLDADGDGFGDPDVAVTGCSAPSGYLTIGGDCDDGSAAVNPEAEDLCAEGADGVDDDCDGVPDNPSDAITYYADDDGDGYGNPLVTVAACSGVPAGYAADGSDCDDTASGVSPAGAEACDGGVDEDCDGDVDCADADCDGLLPCSIDLAEADATLIGESAGDMAGAALGGGFDLDGDGYEDLLVGAPGQDGGGSGAGAAYLVLGPVSGSLDLSLADAILLGAAANDQAGTSLAWVDDVDSDGQPDVLVGAPGADTGGSGAGEAYLLFGGVAGSLDLGLADLTLVGVAAGDEAGLAVAGVGDADGDGLGDVLVGAPGLDDAASDAGGAHLVLGGAVGVLDLAAADAVLLGEAASDAAGEAVAGAGDLDGDGHVDLLIGAPTAAGGVAGSGVVYAVRGPVWGETSLADAWTRVEGIAAGDTLRLAAAGDLDGDGAGDLLLGADADGRGGSAAGAAYVVLGPLGGVVDLAGADGTLLGDAASARAGAALAVVPDLDADGADEALIGAWGASYDGVRSGTACLVRGAASGLLAEVGACFGSSGASDRVGVAVSSAGDTDGDGIPDLLIGASYQDSGGSAAGVAFILLGNHF